MSELNHFLNNLPENLDYQDFDARIKILGFQINLCFIRVRFPIETLPEENNPEVEEESLIEFLQIAKFSDFWECSGL